jgi:hypothetical protein
MAGAELPCPSIDRPLWPGSGSSGEAGQRASPARYDDDSGKRVEGLAARLAPLLIRSSSAKAKTHAQHRRERTLSESIDEERETH